MDLRGILHLGVLVLCGAWCSQDAHAALTERVSVNSSEAQANEFSEWPSVSADGRFVAFASGATNLVAGDTNGFSDIFVRDRLTGATERVSIGAAGEQGNDHSQHPSISADGRYVAFASRSSSFLPGDTVFTTDVFVRDRIAGTIERISVSAAGHQGDNRSEYPSISADGRYVAFLSLASNLIPGDTNFNFDAYVKDRLTRNIERASVSSAGAQIPAAAEPRISGDGRYVVFIAGPGVVPGDTNGVADVFLRDRIALTTTRVSVSSTEAEANGASAYAAINGDGRFIAFAADATNLVAGDTNAGRDVFVRDRQTGTTERVSVNSAEAQSIGGNSAISFPSISADGRFVIFDSFAPDLVPGDTNNEGDVFARDRLTGTTTRVSVNSAGAQSNDPSYSYSVSADGRFVGFHSTATNLVAGDTNAVQDAFLRDRGPQAAPPANDLLADVGTRGLWQFLNNRTWLKIDNASPVAIAVGDLDGNGKSEAVASFAGRGLHVRYNNAAPWRKLHNTAAARIAVGDLDGNGKDELIADRGATGIFARFNNAGAFVKLHTSTSQALAVGDLDGNGKDELIADRGSTGLWVRRLNPQNIAAWVKLHSASPTHIATGDLDGNGKDELIVANLGASGVFVRYNNAGAFVKKQASPIQGLATGDLDGNGKDEVIADFGSLGLRAFYNNAAPWVKLDTRNPTNAIAADLDSSGKAEVVADFGASGLFVRFNNTGAFRQLRAWPSQAIAAGGFD